MGRRQRRKRRSVFIARSKRLLGRGSRVGGSRGVSRLFRRPWCMLIIADPFLTLTRRGRQSILGVVQPLHGGGAVFFSSSHPRSLVHLFQAAYFTAIPCNKYTGAKIKNTNNTPMPRKRSALYDSFLSQGRKTKKPRVGMK